MRRSRVSVNWQLVFAVLALLTVPGKAQEIAAVPLLERFTSPKYPPLARQARITGSVHVEITTDGTRVLRAVAVDGHKLLSDPIVQNVLTWRYAPHTPAKFNVTFNYKLGDIDEVKFDSPKEVTLTGRTPEVYAVFGTEQLGEWDAELQGGIRQRMVLSASPYSLRTSRESVSGEVSSQQGGTAEILDGTLDRGNIDFTVFFGDLKIIYMGRLTESEIRGTFMDSSGATGFWSAKKQPK